MLFNEEDRIYNKFLKKNGTIKYLRDSEYERNLRKNDSSHYRYFVEYDDKSFDTYVSSFELELVNK
jgi:hypothetical protein